MAKKKIVKKKKNSLPIRPPVVVILGHVDHGKTSLLDYIRKTQVTEKESGGITQHIGAYQAKHQDKTITFVDTPGHEAFSAMRSRGAKVADIAILVVAAEEGLKPQTKEAITHIKKCGIPMIVALNKIDKKEAQPEKVKGELSKYEVVVESLGGEIPSINVSAKTGQGIEELLEMLNLVAEMEEFTDDPNQTAAGVIIESRHDTQRGATATLLVKSGMLKNRDIVGTGSAFGRIKTMEDFQLNPIKEASASTPTVITGFNQAPQVGEKFAVFNSLDEARIEAARKTAKRDAGGTKEVFDFDSDKKVLNIILKADVRGSLEAIRESLKSIPDDEVILRILKAEVGEITESDIKTAESAKAKIFGFRIKASGPNKQLAQHKKIKITIFEIIYELIQDIRESLSKLLEPEIIKHNIGQLKVLALFKTEKDKQIVGGKVIKGQVKKGALVSIIGKEKAPGKIIQLQRDKKETNEVNKGHECGLAVKGLSGIEKSDILEIYEEKRKKREI